MSLNPITLINELIEEHGSARIQAKHLLFLKEQIVSLKEQVSSLEEENVAFKAENSKLHGEIDLLNSQKKTGEECPYCFKPEFRLIESKPHTMKQLAAVGQKVEVYECGSCNKQKEKVV